jgi:two-component system sensor histidine kinase KdpD
MEPESERVLVCIGPSPTSAKVIRTAARVAASLGVPWTAASVETGRTRALSDAARDTLLQNLTFAARLGAETVTLSGDDVAEEILSYARAHSATRIVIGKSKERGWQSLVRGTIVDRLLRSSGDIDIYVVQGAAEAGTAPPPSGRRRIRWQGYPVAVAAVTVASLVAWLLQEAGLSEANKSVVFIPAVITAAVLGGFGPGIVAAVLSVLAFDFFFVPPYFTLAVADVEYVVTLLVLAAVALLVGTLAARLRRQVETARKRERRLEVLYRLSRALSDVSGVRDLASAAERELSSIFETKVIVCLPGSAGVLEAARRGTGDGIVQVPDDPAAAAWTFEQGKVAGTGTGAFDDATALYLPMITAQGTVGVLAVESPEGEALASPENRQLLETAATQLGTAIERDILAQRTRASLLEAETERVRSSLLSSVSHDLRTPLAVIAGTTSTLLELAEGTDPATRHSMLTEVYEESDRLARLVENLLAMTRLDSGQIVAVKEWFPLEDVIGSTLGRLKKQSRGRVISKHLPADLPMVPLDGVMIEQVLFNLVDNALKYSPPEAPVDITVSAAADEVTIEVADRGPGLAKEEVRAVFDRLYRGTASSGSARGAGLGLAIAQAIVQVHGGRIWAANRPGGGAVFAFTLPLQPPPGMDVYEESDTEEEE